MPQRKISHEVHLIHFVVQHVESLIAGSGTSCLRDASFGSLARDPIVPLYWQQSLSHWTTREVPSLSSVRNFSIDLFPINYYFWLHWAVAAVCGFLIVVMSPAVEHRLQAEASVVAALGLLVVAHGLWRAGSVVVAQKPSCCVGNRISLDQEWNPCPLHWQADFYPLCHQGSPKTVTMYIWN